MDSTEQKPIGDVAMVESAQPQKPDNAMHVEAWTNGPKSKAEKKLVRKLDATILPMLTFSFFIAYLIMKFQEDLNISNKKFFNCLMIFYVGYLVFLLPSNLTMRVVGPRLQLGSAIMLFGIASACLLAAKGYASVMGLRVLVGVGEAFTQTGLLCFTLWYRGEEMATRGAIYYTSATISGCFSGLIVYGVTKNLEGVHGRHSWQWLYIIEAIPAIALGLLFLVCFPSFPEKVVKSGHRLFSAEELLLIEQRNNSINAAHASVKVEQIWVALREPKVYLMAFAVGVPGLSIGAISSFLPTFIKGFGFSSLDTQLYAIIPYAVSTVTLLLACYLSDRFHNRSIPFLICLTVAVIGYIILITCTRRAVLVLGTCFAAGGTYPTTVLSATWVTTNHLGYTKRSTAWAVAQGSAQIFSIISTQIYRTPPRYYLGHGLLIGFLISAMLTTVLSALVMWQANRKKDERNEEFQERGELDPERLRGFEEVYDYHPGFRYNL